MSVLLALFSALGAVLLFLLKLVGILLLIGMVLLALVLFCPFCADVQWEQGVFTVKAGAPVSYTHLTLATTIRV